MKAYEETIRKYYKYIPFVQPILSENGTMGGDVFACNQSAYHTESSGTKREAWAVFSNTSNRWQVNSIDLNTFYYVEWYNPIALYITSLSITNSTGDYSVKDYVLYGSDNGSNWIELTSGTNSNVTTGSVWTITVNLTEAYKYFRLSCKGRVTTSVMIYHIGINAYTGIEESTSSDYDFYKDMNIYKGTYNIIEHDVSTKTFNAGVTLQEWTVPNGITKLHVDCTASRGNQSAANAGKGGRVQCDLDVTPGQALYFTVGGIPMDGRVAEYNASDIRTNRTSLLDETSLQSRLIVAGGGGSSATGSNYPGNGGDGGDLVGGDGTGGSWNTQAYGGTQTEGGNTGRSSGGTTGQKGTFGLGGNGNYGWGGGAGGAGWYGGGGAGNYGTSGRTSSGGGGGGSSYTDSTLCSDVIHTQGFNNDEGYITITANGSWKEYVDEYKVFKI